MKQLTFIEDSPINNKYSSSNEGPIYKPSGRKPHILELCDVTKTNMLLQDIRASGLPDHEKRFLELAAHRHAVFNYELIADYYAAASSDMQKLMQDSALVIVDVDRAIELGYVRLCDAIKKLYMEEAIKNA